MVFQRKGLFTQKEKRYKLIVDTTGRIIVYNAAKFLMHNELLHLLTSCS